MHLNQDAEDSTTLELKNKKRGTDQKGTLQEEKIKEDVVTEVKGREKD